MYVNTGKDYHLYCSEYNTDGSLHNIYLRNIHHTEKNTIKSTTSMLITAGDDLCYKFDSITHRKN